MQVCESLGQPGVERSKHTGKAESPNRPEVCVSMARALVSDSEAYEEAASC